MKLFPLFLFLALCGCASPDGGRDVAHIRNSRYVSRAENIAVTSEPTTVDLIVLKGMGFSNVVCFIKPHATFPVGMTVHAFPISTWRQIFGGPRLAAIYEQAIPLIGPGTEVFCQFGANRSGTAYIIELMKQGFSKEQAIALADRYGWGTSLPGLKAYVRHLK